VENTRWLHKQQTNQEENGQQGQSYGAQHEECGQLKMGK